MSIGDCKTYSIVVFLQIFGYHGFMSCQSLFEVGKRVARDPKRRFLDMVREGIEAIGVKESLCQYFMPEHFAKDHACVQRNVWILVPASWRNETYARFYLP